ncbi:MAG: ATP phosphoribosyltransferase regulatory subunit [Lachnospiraceae bacterium]|nr:ATP phosphoribosyltransferase regulatory subunit [Lachnospiraceae bacterium]
MDNKLLHTPEGVRDIYGEELRREFNLKLKILDILHAHHYEDINTPTFEFFDVFSSNIGTTPSNELYKFFDKDGNTLVLRPDFTPAICRCVAKYYREETEPLRFCYCGNTFINNSDYQGRLKETTQIGAELFNDPSARADAEIIEIVLETLKKAGLSEFQITIGNVEYFKGLCSQYSIDHENEMSLREFISNKSYFGAEALLNEAGISSECRESIMRLFDLFGPVSKIEEALKDAGNERSENALKRLMDIYGILKEKGLEDYISFDLGVLSKYHYYTGMVFSGYTYGSGDAIVKGGRYDSLLSEFGKEAPAIGFAIVLDRLLNLMK